MGKVVIFAKFWVKGRNVRKWGVNGPGMVKKGQIGAEKLDKLRKFSLDGGKKALYY